MMRIAMALLLTAVASLACAEGVKTQADVQVDGAWVREVPPVSSTSAAFMRIHNSGRKALVLTRIDSPVAQAAELHVMSMAGGVMRMDRLPTATIPAGGDLVLDPDSKHIMLFGLKAPLKAGQQVQLTLHFRNGNVTVVQAPVKPDTE